MAGRLREDRGVRRPAAAAGAAAAAVEDRQRDAGLAATRGELLLRAVDRPLRGEVAAVLAGVGVADHHLDVAAARGDACRVPLVASSVRRTSGAAARSAIVSKSGTTETRLVAQVEHARARPRPRSWRRRSPCRARAARAACARAATAAKTSRVRSVGARSSSACSANVELREVEAEELDAPRAARRAARRRRARRRRPRGCGGSRARSSSSSSGVR